MLYYSVYNKFYKNPKFSNPGKIRRYFGKCELIVVRRTMNNSKPCQRCLNIIKSYGIKRVYYSYDGKLIKEKTNEMSTEHLSSRYRVPWNEFN